MEKTKANEYEDDYVVKFRKGIVVGIGKTMQEAWIDAKETAERVLNK